MVKLQTVRTWGAAHLALISHLADRPDEVSPYGLDFGRANADPALHVRLAPQVNEATDKSLAALAERLSQWPLTPTGTGTEGYRKAEVTAGGVDTRVLSSQTMESKQPGLYFVGEVVDVRGWRRN